MFNLVNFFANQFPPMIHKLLKLVKYFATSNHHYIIKHDFAKYFAKYILILYTFLKLAKCFAITFIL